MMMTETMQYHLTIPGKQPNLNDWISRMNVNKFRGAAMKKDAQQYMIVYIKKQLRGIVITNPVKIHYVFYEPDKKRDKSNVASFFVKVFEDALQECKILQNDSWKYIESYSHEFYVDAKNPRIEITISVSGGQ